MQGSGAMATGILVKVLALGDSAVQEKTTAPCIVWLAGSATCDVLIASCMLYFVSHPLFVLVDAYLSCCTSQLLRGRQGLASDAMISRLVRLTVETGSVTASVAIVDLILFLCFKHNNLHMTPYVTTCHA